MMTPKIRNQLRQADKVAASGKRSAAVELYQQILVEDDAVAAAWAGLGHVLLDEAERENAYQKALSLDADNQEAQRGLAELRNEPLPAESDGASAGRDSAVGGSEPSLREAGEDEKEAEGGTLESDIYPHAVDISEFILPDGTMVCYGDRSQPTTLRCNRCGRPICSKYSKLTSVGYRCLVCIREIEDEFFTAETKDYVIATAVATPLSFIIGALVGAFGFGGIFFWFILFAVGGALGSFVGRVVFRAIGRRRGRYIPYVVATIVAVGGILPALVFGSFLSGAIYAFAATSAAYYQLR